MVILLLPNGVTKMLLMAKPWLRQFVAGGGTGPSNDSVDLVLRVTRGVSKVSAGVNGHAEGAADVRNLFRFKSGVIETHRTIA